MALLVKNFRRNRMVELNVGFEVTVLYKLWYGMSLFRHIGLCSDLIVDFLPKWLASKEKRSIEIGGIETGDSSEKKCVKNDCIYCA